MSFDQEPDGDPHGECAAEIKRLTEERAELLAALNEFSEAFNNRGETTTLHAWNGRMKVADAHAIRAIARCEARS